MERTFTVGKNGYGDPKFEVTVHETGLVSITERDPHNGMRLATITMKPDDLNTLFAELNLK